MADKDSETYPGNTKISNPVTLRLGELEPEVMVRMGESAAGAIVKRDLGRYYRILADGLRPLYFSLAEAEAIVKGLQGFNAASIRYLWAEIERLYLENDDEPNTPPHWYLPDDLDAAALVEKLRGLTLPESIAVLDAVERYWATSPDTGPQGDDLDVEALIKSGLVNRSRAEHGEKERNAQRGKMIVRDPAARLRRKQDSPYRTSSK